MSDMLQRFRLALLARRDGYARVRAMVDGAQLIDDLLDEVNVIHREADDEMLSLAEASRICGYSADHLGALVRKGKLTNYGRPGAPRVRASELPRKVGALTAPRGRAKLPLQIAREVAHSPHRRSDDQA